MENIPEVKFLTAQELLEMLRRLRSTPEEPCSKYRLAKILGMTPQGLLHVINHGGTLSDENAIILAEELDLPPYYVMLCMHLQRAKDDKTRDAWKGMAAKLLKASAFLFAVTLPLFSFVPSLS